MKALLALILTVLSFEVVLLEAAEAPSKGLEIARMERADPVDFYREIVPVLQANCLPCHNKTTTKADLLLETPADMLKGGESGPAVVPGKASDSLLLQLAAHLQKPRMPPKDNKVNAVNLSPRDLGLLSLWIDQGAKATGKQEEVIAWQALASGVRPILAAAISADGQWSAFGRGNQLELVHLPTAQRIGHLADPALSAGSPDGAAHRDWVNAVAFSPDGRHLASGGFREIKLWEKIPAQFQKTERNPTPAAFTNGGWISPDGTRLAKFGTNGMLQLTDGVGTVIEGLSDDPQSTQTRRVAQATLDRARVVADQLKVRLESAQKETQSQRDRLKRAQEALAAAAKILAEKDAVLDRARRERLLAEANREVVLRKVAGVTNASELKVAEDRLTAARGAADKAEAEQRPAALKASTADNERTLAMEGGYRAGSVQARTEWLLGEAIVDLRRAEAGLKTVEAAGKSKPSTNAVAAFSPDNRWLVTADPSGRLVRWTATNGVPVDSLRAPGRVKALSFASPDESLIATSEGNFAVQWMPRWEWKATLTNTPDGKLADRIGALAFSPDGRWLVSGGGEPSRSGELWFWDTESLKPVFGLPQLHSDAILTLAFSPDGRWLATGGADRFARLVEVASGRQVRALEGHTGHVLGVGWRSDGQALATAGADLLVKFWDPVTGERRKQATGFSHEVTGVAHLTGTDQWVVASGDAGLRVVNENGEKVRTLAGADDFTQALAVSPDGQWVVAGGQDGVLRVWSSKEEPPRLLFPPESGPKVSAAD